MALVGLYGALAASASVFIGILTALLASDLSSLKAERTRIRRRIDQIDTRLRGLSDRRETLHETISSIEEHWANQNAAEQVEEFIDYLEDNVTMDPDEVLPGRVQELFADYRDTTRDDLTEHQHRVLQDQFDDIEDAVTPDPVSPFGVPTIGPMPPPAEIKMANRQIEAQWDIHDQQRYDANYREWVQTDTEMGSLRRERDRLEGRYESLDPAQTISDIKASGVTIIASVLVPLVAFLLREIELTIPFGSTAEEAILITIIWAAGLGWVLYHLWRRINWNEEDLPDFPNFTTD